MASNQQGSINLGLARIPDVSDQKLFAELLEIHNAIRILSGAVDFYTGSITQDSDVWPELSYAETIRSQNIKKLYVIASEDIDFGAVVHLHPDAGVLKVRNANATDDSRPVRGYASNAAILTGNMGEVTLFNGLHPFFTGLTLGADYYLSTTDGLLTTTAPSSPGNLVQYVGFALSATDLYFCPSQANNVVVP